MSIYIKGLSFPKDGSSLTIQICPDGSVWKQNWGTVTRAKAIHVPDHGRLIDADEIKKRISHMNMEAYMDGACYGIHPSLEYLDLLNEILDDAPTIIPAEEKQL